MILVTGASSNVGRELVKQLASAGAAVRAGFQSPAGAKIPDGVSAVPLDFSQPDTLRSALHGVKSVFLVGPPSADLVPLERMAADAFKEAGVELVIKLCAMGGAGSIFPRLHLESEQYILSLGLPSIFLRANGFMQNMVNYNAASIRTQNCFYGSEGEGRVSYVDVRDIAAVAAKLLLAETPAGQALTITGPEALDNSTVAAILSAELAREIRFINLPSGQLRSAVLDAGVPAWNADAIVDLQRFYREGNASEVSPDVERVLGRKPISFAEFCQDYRGAFLP